MKSHILQQNFMERNIDSCIRSILVQNIENKEKNSLKASMYVIKNMPMNYQTN